MNGNIVQMLIGSDGFASKQMEMHHRSEGLIRASVWNHFIKTVKPHQHRIQIPCDLTVLAYEHEHRIDFDSN